MAGWQNTGGRGKRGKSGEGNGQLSSDIDKGADVEGIVEEEGCEWIRREACPKQKKVDGEGGEEVGDIDLRYGEYLYEK